MEEAEEGNDWMRRGKRRRMIERRGGSRSGGGDGVMDKEKEKKND